MDPFCVDKSMVMITMMKDSAVNALYIVEVWLSSLWSKVTLRSFKKATRCILNIHNDSIDNEVKVIIEYWNRAKKSSNKAALKFQFQALMANADSKFAMQCCFLLT